MEVELRLGSDRRGLPRDPDARQRVLIIGAFAGASQAASRPLLERSLLEVDAFDIDSAMTAMRIAIDVPGDTAEQALEFDSLDDFHPDSLCEALPRLNSIVATRRALMGAGSASEDAALTARELIGDSLTDSATSTPPGSAPPEAEADDDMMTRLLGKPRTSSPAQDSVAARTVQRLAAQAAGPSGDVDHATRTQLAGGLDALATAMLRDVLHCTSFQRTESAWRSVRWIADHLDADVDCELAVFDLDIADIVSFCESEPGNDAALVSHVTRQWRQHLMDASPDLIVSLLPASADPDALHALMWTMDLARELNAPLLAGADCALAGIREPARANPFVDASDVGHEDAEPWSRLRSNSGADMTAVGLPHFLLRQPYGPKSDPIDSFAFDELDTNPGDEMFLWGSASVAMAVVWLQTRAGEPPALNDMPIVIYDDGGGQAIMPPTRLFLSDSAATALANRGFTALRAARNSTTVSIPRIVTVGTR
jgi:type VI secretion system ImpB/VipA family protein